MASTNLPKRRFVPIPIETTFQSNRKISMHGVHQAGPIPEPTPEPSPRSASPPIPHPPPPPPPRHRRRFKPQLIETSRRTHRVGDPGPATKPADKTDITPYTNHIYVARIKHRRKNGESVDDESVRHMPLARRESEDEGVKEYLLEVAAKEASRQMVEDALAAFPNSRAREGGVAHFYFRESSGSDNSAENTPQHQQDGAAQFRVRRKSSNLGLNWWHKHMQNHAEQLAQQRGSDEMALDTGMDAIMQTDSDLDAMELPVPPDPLWTTTNRIVPDDGRGSMADRQDLRNFLTPLAWSNPETSRFATGNKIQLCGDAALGRPSPSREDAGFSPIAGGRPAADRGPNAGFSRPFDSFGLLPDDHKLYLMRQAASPPMLGKELTFRQCPSPKQTKLETDHPFFHNEAYKDHNRDTTGQAGLWQGYCFRSESSKGYVVPAESHGTDLLVTPYPPASPRDTGVHESRSMCEEPDPMLSPSDPSESYNDNSSSSSSSSNNNNNPASSTRSDNRLRTSHSKGLHMLHGLDERLRREKAQIERDEKIASEFGDEFVTQVYNYLSLGYPATARSFDEELSKISRVTMKELCLHDEKKMAKGHMLEMTMHVVPEEERCPRWKALRIYITEWARQHPDLDNLDPLAWGVRERRGSWAI